MQDALRWFLILVTIAQAIAIVANKPPVTLSRGQIAVIVFFDILLVLALLPSN